MSAGGKTGYYKVVDVSWIYPTMSDTQYLDIEEDTTILCTKRLRFVDDVPTMIETNHYGKGFSFLEGEDLNQSLYDILSKTIKLTLGKGHPYIRSCICKCSGSKFVEYKKRRSIVAFYR